MTARPLRIVHLGATCAALLLAGACDRASEASERAQALLTDSTRHVVRIGTAPDDDPASSLSRVVAVRMTDDGGHVVVLEWFAPFVRVFTREGRLRSSFVKAGGGPREMRRPAVLALSGDSAVLVVDGSGRAAVYDLDGRLRREVRGFGFPVLAAAPACGDEWIVYGPRFQQGGRRARWLHRVRLGDGGSVGVVSAFDDSLAATSFGIGLATGGVRTRAPATLFRHTLGREPGVLEWSCGGAAPRLLPDPESQGEGGPGTAVPGGVALTIRPGDRSPGGMAAVTGGYAVADLVFAGGRGNDRTEITLVRGEDRRRVTVRGRYVLQDGKPGAGVLVGTSDPLPRIFVLREADFLALF